ncbi:MAG: glycosyltransferase family 39 protein [Anaerolineae bacterium]|nr:glycosyltransferase family 39 protein [Anaerolineae bacterium]MDW8102919.1 glycosyltransferase family 39 protein [Anaerolineae bacterium]
MRALKPLVLLGILVAFFLRVHTLGDKNIWWDEGLAIWAVRQSWLETTLWTAGDVHPPLYFWLLWFWIRIAGETEFLARYLTVIMATLTVATVFPLVRRLGGAEAGLLALWLLGFSRFHIWWSQEMRMYIPAALFFTLSGYFLLKAISSVNSRKFWVGWVISCSAALYTLYSAVFLLPVCAVPILMEAFKKPIQRRLLAESALATGAVTLLWVPWVTLAFPKMKSWSIVEEPASLGFALKLNAVLLATGISTHLERLLPFSLFVVIAALAGLPVYLLKREKPKAIPGIFLLLSGVILQPLTVWILTQPRPIFYVPKIEARYFIPAAPFFYSLLALSLEALGGKFRPAGLLLTGVIFISMAAFLPQYYAERDWEDDIPTMLRLIQVYGRPGDAVILISGDRFPKFIYYLPKGLNFPIYTAPRISPLFTPETVEAELGWITSMHSRIWVAAVKPFLQDPEGIAVKWLSERMKVVLAYHFKLDSLYLFSHRKETPFPSREIMPITPLNLKLSPGVKILGYDLMDQRGKQGTTIHLGLFLELEEPASLWVEALSPLGTPFPIDYFSLEPGYHYKMVEFKVALFEGGTYRLRVRVDSEALYIGEVKVKGGGPVYPMVDIRYPLSARIGDRIKLLGYNLIGVSEPPVLRPGGTLILELFWEAEAPIERSYTVFTHLLGPVLNPATGKPVWAQDDQEPLEGLYPTTHWVPNVPLKDRYELVLPPDAPPGDYILEVGMYLRETGERLPVSGERADPESRRIVIRTIRVED